MWVWSGIQFRKEDGGGIAVDAISQLSADLTSFSVIMDSAQFYLADILTMPLFYI